MTDEERADVDASTQNYIDAERTKRALIDQGYPKAEARIMAETKLRKAQLRRFREKVTR